VRNSSLQSTTVNPQANWSYLSSFYPTLPDGSWSIVEGGMNNSSATSAILCEQPATFGYNFGVFSANVGAKTSTAFIPLNPPTWGGFTQGAAGMIDYDPTANVAYVMLWAPSFFGNDDVLATVNFGTGTASYQDLGDQGEPLDFVVDPNTHVGAMTEAQSFGMPAVALFNLSTGTITAQANIPSSSIDGTNPLLTKLAVDTVHSRFAVQNVFPGGDATDNNPLSAIDFIDESGNLVSETPRYYNLASFTLGDHWFQLNPTTRTGFMDGPDFTQIIPFQY
jgi:hypothetical protein